jgi:hypothetical protein
MSIKQLTMPPMTGVASVSSLPRQFECST